MALQRIPISTGWHFKNTKDSDKALLPVSGFPTVIHLDLLKHGKIPEPFQDANEAAIQWVGEEAWIYQTTFTKPIDQAPNSRTEIVFEGLDTFATISLNGQVIKTTDNMFLTYRVDVTESIQETNTLTIAFESAWYVGKRLENEAEYKPAFCHNGDSSRLQVRKAQYSYGWDWGPTILTSGPWRPIYLETFISRIADLSIKSSVDESLTQAEVEILVTIDGARSDQDVLLSIHQSDGTALAESRVSVEDGRATTNLPIDNPELWFPAGNGAQPLYAVIATLLANTSEFDRASKRIGLRRLELIQRPLESAPGTTFFFQVNNVPIFSRGGDWIPADSMLSRLTPEKYRAWVQFAKDGGHNMIRVWGGGVYETDEFYEACDEFGIMVWHDFMLGCGAYPATLEFLENVEEEARFQVRRLRHHPSIVLWCGNNEDHMFADRYDCGYDPENDNPEDWLQTNWPARIIYDKILPDVCAIHVPEIPYHPGSPWGGRPSNDPTIGDVHSWDVWMKALPQYPYQYYPRLAGRFVSEFGVKSHPSVRTWEWTVTDIKQRYPQSRAIDAHQKSASKTPWHMDWRNIAVYMYENVRHGYQLDQFVYASQLVQAEAMMYAYVYWRRLWKGPGKEECAGALVWQLNDCWPVASWSLGDYFLRPKLAYFIIKRAVAPLSIAVARNDVEVKKRDKNTRAHIQKRTMLEVWGSNFTTKDVDGEVLIEGFDLASGKVLWKSKIHDTIRANQSHEIMTLELPRHTGPTIVAARLFRRGRVVARFADWPQPLRHLDLPRTALNVTVAGDRIKLSSKKPIKAVQLSIDDDEVKFDDNCLDVMPGDEQIVHAKGLTGRMVEVMHLGIATDDTK